MNNTTTARLNDGAQMGGNDTANIQNTITIQQTQINEWKSLLLDLVIEGFAIYFKTQPIAMAALGKRIQCTKSVAEQSALTAFVERNQQINGFLYDVVESRPMLNNILGILESIESGAKFIVTK